MYIKVERKPPQQQDTQNGTAQKLQNIANGSPGTTIPGIGPIDTKNLSHIVTESNNTRFINNIRPVSHPSDSNHPRPPPVSTGISSLNFLHKPKRVSSLNKDTFPEEELRRITAMNKNITTRTDIPADQEYFDSLQTPQRNNFLDIDSSNDSLMYFPAEPVYKKSGELVKSSLKRRSKSLPSTPLLPVEGIDDGAGKRRIATRSKSVHFDQRTPVKYFSKDESPIDVSRRDEYSKLLHFFSEGSSSTSKSKQMEIEKHAMTKDLSDLDLEDDKEHKGLRRSKIFQDFLFKTKQGADDDDDDDEDDEDEDEEEDEYDKGKNKRDDGDMEGEYSDGDSPTSTPSRNDSPKGRASPIREGLYADIRRHKVIGLYNLNFPTLMNANPKSLKWNIFVNLSQNKQCFPQELVLYQQRRRGMSGSQPQPLIITPENEKGLVARYIIGKILVKNVFYDKRVIVRYTWNGWKTHKEVECVWISSGEGILPGTNMDVFQFIIDDVNRFNTNMKMEFCVHFISRNNYETREVWDNNDGKNYKVDVILYGFNNPFDV